MRIEARTLGRTLTCLALAVLAVTGTRPASLMASPSAADPCTTTLPAGADIQAAIDNASSGDVICLEPGTYSPTATITIGKSITLQGPQAGVDPRPSACTTRTAGDASTEAIIDAEGNLAIIIDIGADNVVIDGLEVKSGTGDMINQSSACTGTVVNYNIIHDGRGDEGVQLRQCTSCVLEYNYVYDIAAPGDGLNISRSSVDGMIRFNEVHDIGSENAAIYVYGSTNTTIQCNLVYTVTQNDGIKLGNKGGNDATLQGGTISYNVVHDTAQDGITVYMSDTVVEGNEVYNSTSENGAIYLAFGISNIDIIDNYVHDNNLVTRKWDNSAGIMIKSDVVAASVRVNNNNIERNSPNGVTNRGTTELDATGNWWNAADGPGGAGSGGGDAVSTDVDFSSWLTSPAEPQSENPCVGYLTIVKEADPADGTDFPFLLQGSCGDDAFTLDDADPDDGDAFADSKTFAKPAGSYVVTELVPDGWSLDDIICAYDPPNGTGDFTVDLDDAVVEIDLSLGETVICTFSNSKALPVGGSTMPTYLVQAALPWSAALAGLILLGAALALVWKRSVPLH